MNLITPLGLDPVQSQGFQFRFAKHTSLSHPSLNIVTSRRPSSAENGEVRSELESPHGRLPMMLSGLSFY